MFLTIIWPYDVKRDGKGDFLYIWKWSKLPEEDERTKRTLLSPAFLLCLPLCTRPFIILSLPPLSLLSISLSLFQTLSLSFPLTEQRVVGWRYCSQRVCGSFPVPLLFKTSFNLKMYPRFHLYSCQILPPFVMFILWVYSKRVNCSSQYTTPYDIRTTTTTHTHTITTTLSPIVTLKAHV